jgi:selenocysteine-specific elongation factor
MTLAAPGKWRATRRVDVRLELLASAPKLKHRARVHFHAGTTETIAEVFLYEPGGLAPGNRALAQLRLHEEALVLPGDRFIVRQFSPVITIGGGIVLDPLARRPALRDTGRVAFLETLEQGERGAILATMTERATLGLGWDEILARTGWTEREARDTIQQEIASKRLVAVAEEPAMLVPAKLFERVQTQILDKVAKFQKENPLLPGIAREDLRASLGRRVRAETFRTALANIAAQKKLDVQGELVKRAGSGIELLPEELRAKDEIEKAFASAGLAVPSVKEVLAKLPVDAKRAEKILQILLRDKSLVRVSLELIFHRDALAEMRGKLAGYKKTKGERISVPVFKDLTGITRKYAIPLLEYLDRERVTRRAGDERVIL